MNKLDTNPIAKKPTPKYKAAIAICMSGNCIRNMRPTMIAAKGSIMTLEVMTILSLRQGMRWNKSPKVIEPRMPPRKTRPALAPLNELE